MSSVSIKAEYETDDELDDIPIKQRLEELAAKIGSKSNVNPEKHRLFLSPEPISVFIKEESNVSFETNTGRATSPDSGEIDVIMALPVQKAAKGNSGKQSHLANIQKSSVKDPHGSSNSSLGSSSRTQNNVPSFPHFLGNIKAEALEIGSDSHNVNGMNTSGKNTKDVFVKSEVGKCEESYEYVIDNLTLRQRKEFLLSGSNTSNMDCFKNLNCSRETLPSSFESASNILEPDKPEGILRPKRKRKKTATESVETALEEDAPGLLKVLVDKGILLDEIKLYGLGTDDENPLDISEEDSFGDLENVVSKLFSQRSSLFKFTPLGKRNPSRPCYCLACLLSLVEQTRYLVFRNWPVEWGWCRDLQSFIFVFERHNRIVLERPEYGFATYFFELVDSLPIDWQIKRLVTAMKLTSCSRTTLIENKPLLVGEDLTEGEARVLEEYGWTPNTGLGTMLKYCDRVVHDRKNEAEDVSDWRGKIGKLLMNGFDGGTIVLDQLPKKFKGYNHNAEPTVQV